MERESQRRRRLAAVDDLDADLARLLICGDGRVVACTFAPTAGTFGEVTPIHPGADQTPVPGQAPYDPAMAALPGGWLYSWVQYVAGTPYTERQAVVTTTVDGVHCGAVVPLDLDAALPGRAALAYHSSRGAVYAADLNTTLAATVYREADATLNRSGLTVRALPADGWGPERWAAACHHPGSRWRVVGRRESGGAVAPLAELTLARGYLTRPGAENGVHAAALCGGAAPHAPAR
jgi:hypothetical protein